MRGRVVDLDTCPATPDRLADELTGCLRSGVTTRGLLICPGLLALSLVAAKSATDESVDRAAAAHGLLREAVVCVDGGTDGVTGVLLGLAVGTRGTLLKARRRQAAELLSISPEHLRTSDRERDIIAAVADEVYALDSAYRLRHRHRLEPEREAGDTRAGVNWLELHQAYRRVWTPVSALRDDLWVLLQLMDSDDPEPFELTDRVVTMTWRYAQFLVELQRFIDDVGGLWLLADTESEVAAADAVRGIGFYAPFGASDDSWMRTLLLETPNRELEALAERLLTSERGAEVLGVWLEWARGCECPVTEPKSVCLVHEWIEAADRFISLIDGDWYKVADWYRRDPLIDVSGDHIARLWARRDFPSS